MNIYGEDSREPKSCSAFLMLKARTAVTGTDIPGPARCILRIIFSWTCSRVYNLVTPSMSNLESPKEIPELGMLRMGYYSCMIITYLKILLLSRQTRATEFCQILPRITTGTVKCSVTLRIYNFTMLTFTLLCSRRKKVLSICSNETQIREDIIHSMETMPYISPRQFIKPPLPSNIGEVSIIMMYDIQNMRLKHLCKY
jgi:hypothetical protein